MHKYSLRKKPCYQTWANETYYVPGQDVDLFWGTVAMGMIAIVGYLFGAKTT
jgi:hypothetical protein